MGKGLDHGVSGLLDQIGGVIGGALNLAGNVVELSLDTVRLGFDALNGS